MTAAIFAARQQTAEVRLIEKNPILGRKLLATGNGRCNLTNSNCPDALDTLDYLKELGLLTREEGEGRIYPYSEQAAAVQEVLISELTRKKVELLIGTEVKAIEKNGLAFTIKTEEGLLVSDQVILATGGKAGPQFGSTGDGYRFAKAFGHTVVRLMPSLVQMVSDEPYFKELKGVRAKGLVELLRNDRVIGREAGEIQFTEDGLSGICIFNLSREYVREDRIRIDLYPEYSEKALEEFLAARVKEPGKRGLSQLLGGMLHKKLIPVVLSLVSLNKDMKACELPPDDITAIARQLKDWRVSITGTKGWKEAQVTSGGVDLAELDPETLESRLVPGLYFAGELLNVDGKCGGYNLQWAWSSGRKAGDAAALCKEESHAENP